MLKKLKNIKIKDIFLSGAFFYVLTVFMILLIIFFITSSVAFIVGNLEKPSEGRGAFGANQVPDKKFDIEAFERLNLRER